MSYSVLLPHFLGVNNAERRQAEEKYQQMISTSPSQLVLEMISILQSDLNEGHRAITAVLLRGIIMRESLLFSAFNEDEFASFRSQLLVITIQEPIPNIQRKLAHTVATLAQKHTWPELLNSLPELGSSIHPRLKQLCYFLIDKLAEYIGPFLLDHIHVVWTILAPVLDLDLQSPENLSTSISAGNAVLSLLHEIPDCDLDLEKFECLRKGFASICSLLILSCQVEDENSISDIAEGLGRLVKAKPSLFQNCHEIIFQTTQHICLNEDALDSLKCTLLELSSELVTNPVTSVFCSRPSNATIRLQFMSLCIEVMTRVVISEDGSNPNNSYNFSWTPYSDDEFGDEDGDEDHSSGSSFGFRHHPGIALAVASLERLFHIYPIQESLLSIEIVSRLFSQESIGSVRTGLIVVSVLFSVLGAEMQTYLSQCLNLRSILSLGFFHFLQNFHVRSIRICAFLCLQSIILSSISVGDTDSEHAQEGEAIPKFFQESGSYLSIAMSALTGNHSNPRVLFAILTSLRSFCDPQNCPRVVLQGVAGNLLMVLWNILKNPNYPVVLLAESVSLAGNVSLLSSEDVLLACYPHFMAYLKESVCSFEHQDVQQQLQVSKFKGKCFEAAALLGRAVGIDFFQHDAKEIMELICSAHQSGLDFSDPLSSYMVQTGARLAGVYGPDFEPFLQFLIPPLLNHIAEDLQVDILTEGETGESRINDGDEYTIYKRGVGNVRIIHSSYLVSEREMSCRALYQYILDIPEIIYRFAPDMIQSATTIASLFMTEEMCLVLGALLSDSLKIYLKYSTPQLDTISIASQMADKTIEALLGLLRYCDKNHSGTEKEQTQIIQIVVDSLRETLKVIVDGKHTLNGWKDLQISHQFVVEILQILVHEASRWVERNFRQTERVPGLEIEESLWLALSDAAGWILRASPVEETGVAFSTEMLPFLMGLLQASDEAIPLLSMSLSVIIDALDVIPAHSLVLPSSIKSTSYAQFLLSVLFHHISTVELREDCLYGLGVCAKSGDPSFNSTVGEAIGALTPYLGELDESECEEEELVLRDVALGAMFKIGIFCDSVDHLHIISSSLNYFPLSGDSFTAREIHLLFITLLITGDKRLLGANGELFSAALDACVKLINMNKELEKDIIEEVNSKNEFEEAYEEQCMCYPITRHHLESLGHAQIPGITTSMLAAAIKMNPDLRTIFKK